MKYKRTEKEYAEMYDCDVRSIRRYKTKGYPLDDPAKTAELIAAQKNQPGETPENINAAKLKKLQLECERLAFKNEVERGQYTANTKIIEDLYAIGAAVGGALDKLRADLPALLLGKDESGMATLIERETRNIRAMLADQATRLYGRSS